jgi:hypothetical protein
MRSFAQPVMIFSPGFLRKGRVGHRPYRPRSKRQGFAAIAFLLAFRADWGRFFFGRAYSLTLSYMKQAQFLIKLAELTDRFPLRSQEDIVDPHFVAKLFDIC